MFHSNICDEPFPFVTLTRTNRCPGEGHETLFKLEFITEVFCCIMYHVSLYHLKVPVWFACAKNPIGSVVLTVMFSELLFVLVLFQNVMLGIPGGGAIVTNVFALVLFVLFSLS